MAPHPRRTGQLHRQGALSGRLLDGPLLDGLLLGGPMLGGPMLDGPSGGNRVGRASR